MKIQVLDHGYVEFVEAWGVGKEGTDDIIKGSSEDCYNTRVDDHEVGIIEAARQSTQGSFRGWCERCEDEGCPELTKHPQHYHPLDSKLLAYLYNNQHSTPFEFAGMVIEVQAPIFVFREWHRHRTQSYNEASARYAPLADLNYLPTLERLQGVVNAANKQAGALQGTELTEINARRFQEALRGEYARAQTEYDIALSVGVPKELARLVLPVGRYSKMRASANLRNWLAFMTLRCDPAAQWEIQQYAFAVARIIEAKFPQTYKLWESERG